MRRCRGSLVVVVAVAACSAPVQPPPTPTPPPTPVYNPSGQDLGSVCDGRAQPAAPARSAAGPRAVAVAEKASRSGWSLADDRTGHLDQLSDAQIVVCLVATPTEEKRTTCSYQTTRSTAAPDGRKEYGMYVTRFTATAREVRTAVVLGGATASGSEATCPFTLFGEPADGRLRTALTMGELGAILYPYVYG